MWRDCARVALPWTPIGPPSPSLRARTASRSRTTVVLVQAGSVSVVETTTFSMPLNLSANSPSRSGQAAAKPSYVVRPSSSVSVPNVSSPLNSYIVGSSAMSKVQPVCLYFSSPPGASTTPSREMNSVTYRVRISGPLSVRGCLALPTPRRGAARYDTRRHETLSGGELADQRSGGRHQLGALRGARSRRCGCRTTGARGPVRRGAGRRRVPTAAAASRRGRRRPGSGPRRSRRSRAGPLARTRPRRRRPARAPGTARSRRSTAPSARSDSVSRRRVAAGWSAPTTSATGSSASGCHTSPGPLAGGRPSYEKTSARSASPARQQVQRLGRLGLGQLDVDVGVPGPQSGHGTRHQRSPPLTGTPPAGPVRGGARSAPRAPPRPCAAVRRAHRPARAAPAPAPSGRPHPRRGAAAHIPTDRSSARRCWLTAGWVQPSSRAAALIEPARATARKISSRRGSISTCYGLS